MPRTPGQDPGRLPDGEPPEDPRDAAQDDARDEARQPRRDAALSTVGELVQSGGNRAAVGILTYLVIGTAFWSLLGFLLDYLVGTQWLVYAGAGFGLAAGVTLSYLRLQAGLRITDDPQLDDGATRNRRTASNPSASDRGRGEGSRKDRQ